MTDTCKRVLITGIHGFTGQYLARELGRFSHEIFGMGTRPGSEPGYFPTDLTNQEMVTDACRRLSPHWVVHLAAISFVGHEKPNDFYHTNITGTRNLLAALAENNPPPEAVLLAGSAAVYGSSDRTVLTEDTEPNPGSDYAVSKLAMEYMAGLWHPCLPLVVTRPFNYTGVGQSTDFVLPKIVDHFHRREPVMEMGNLDVSRDFCDVRAVVRAYRKLLEIMPAGETVNICSGRAVSLRELIRWMTSLTGHELELRVNPRYVRSNEARIQRGDPGKLRAILGEWDPPSIEETLRWMLESQ